MQHCGLPKVFTYIKTKPMLKSYLLVLLFLLSAYGLLDAQSLTTPPSGGNQKSVVTQYMGTLAHVTVTYNSPDVTGPNGEDRRGKIWGTLVPYGLTDLGFGPRRPAPWRAGANENTTFTFSHDVTVAGKPLSAGTYGFHLIPAASGPWTAIFSHNATAWGSYFYDPAEDALRVEVMPQRGNYHEWLTYDFIERDPDGCTVALRWEEMEVPLRIEVQNMPELYYTQMRRELQNAAGFNPQNWIAGVNFLVQHNLHLEEALSWADYALSAPFIGSENFSTLSAKASVLNKMGRTREASELMDKAIARPELTPMEIHLYGRQLIAQGEKDKAMQIFQYNFERFNGAWPTNFGLARGYAAKGDYKNALKHARIAESQAPDQPNKDNLTQIIERLEKNEAID